MLSLYCCFIVSGTEIEPLIRYLQKHWCFLSFSLPLCLYCCCLSCILISSDFQYLVSLNSKLFRNVYSEFFNSKLFRNGYSESLNSKLFRNGYSEFLNSKLFRNGYSEFFNSKLFRNGYSSLNSNLFRPKNFESLN